MPPGLRRLRLGVGDIAKWRAQAITVSSNWTLAPNENPHYWRFAARSGTNGAVHEMAGPQLLAACRALRPSSGSGSLGSTTATAAAHTRGDQFLPWMPGDQLAGNEPWKVTQKQEESWQEDSGATQAALSSDATRRCDVGQAVVTPAFGRLVTELGVKHVVHVVAPDAISGAPPDEQLLSRSFTAVLEAGTECGATSLALPALGCGVQGWRAAVAARAAAQAIQAATSGQQQQPVLPTLDRVDMVMGSASMWRTWRAVLEKTLGPPCYETAAPTAAADQSSGSAAKADLAVDWGNGGNGEGRAEGPLATWTFE